jgi:hypothetical protein
MALPEASWAGASSSPTSMVEASMTMAVEASERPASQRGLVPAAGLAEAAYLMVRVREAPPALVSVTVMSA